MCVSDIRAVSNLKCPMTITMINIYYRYCIRAVFEVYEISYIFVHTHADATHISREPCRLSVQNYGEHARIYLMSSEYSKFGEQMQTYILFMFLISGALLFLLLALPRTSI